MKQLKRLGLMAIVGAAFMALAASASAVELTSPTGVTYDGPIAAESEEYLTFHGSFGIEVNCDSSLEAEVGEHGGDHVLATVTGLSFTNCTGNYHFSISQAGMLTIDEDGTVFSNGLKFTVQATNLGLTCVFETNNTDIGVLTDSADTGTTATLDLEAQIPRTGGSQFCGANWKWTGAYAIDEPDPLLLDETTSGPGTALTSPEETPYTGALAAASEGHLTIHGSFGVKANCESSLEAEVAGHGEQVVAPVSSFSLTGCTNNYDFTLQETGTLTIDGEGTVRSDGLAFIVDATGLGITCGYTTAETKLGVLTDSQATETTATLDLEASLPRTHGSFLCGSAGTLTGSYVLEATEGESDLLYLDG